MNSAQLAAIIRIVVVAIGAILGTLGVANEVDWVALAGGLSAVAALALSVNAHTTVNMVKSVANSDDVHAIVASPEIADAVDSAKVTAHRP
jgi:hypothetical protein